MPSFDVLVSNFQGQYAALNGTKAIRTSRLGFMATAIMTGLPRISRRIPDITYAIQVAIGKAMALQCAIEFNNDILAIPARYLNLDSTEKGNFSYWTGMAFASIIAKELLRIPRLHHASTYTKAQIVRLDVSSKSLVDLIGKDTHGNWHAIEAKARQNKPSSTEKADWKKQATTISTVNGAAMATCSYSVARVESPYSATLTDPPPGDGQPRIDLAVDELMLLRMYYAPLLEWLIRPRITVEREGQRLSVRLAGFDETVGEYIFLGLARPLVPYLGIEEWPTIERPIDLPDTYVGSDGVAIVVSSSPELQRAT
jgi:hypothetical protein